MKPANLQKKEPPTLTSASFEELVREMIVRLGEDPIARRPCRAPPLACSGHEFLTKGYKEDPDALLQRRALHRQL